MEQRKAGGEARKEKVVGQGRAPGEIICFHMTRLMYELGGQFRILWQHTVLEREKERESASPEW